MLKYITLLAIRGTKTSSYLGNAGSIQDLIDAINKPLIAIDHLKRSKIFLISEQSDDVSNVWMAHRCIYAELDWDGRFFLLNNGRWYEVEKDFTDRINKDFTNIPRSGIDFIDYEENHDGETQYNKALAQHLDDSCCMDAQMIMHGGGRSRIEFCDVLTSKKQLIHVKRYSGSAQLSHLFAQGVVSAELYATDSHFRQELNLILPNSHKLENPANRPDPKEYEIVYGIISKSNRDLDIPFFSKVTLKNARSRLEGYGYTVSIKKIQAIVETDMEDVIENLP